VQTRGRCAPQEITQCEFAVETRAHILSTQDREISASPNRKAVFSRSSIWISPTAVKYPTSALKYLFVFHLNNFANFCFVFRIFCFVDRRTVSPSVTAHARPTRSHTQTNSDVREASLKKEKKAIAHGIEVQRCNNAREETCFQVCK